MMRFLRSDYCLPVLTLLVLVAIAGTRSFVGHRHAAAILNDIVLDDGAKPDIKIFLPFEPERFHLELFQEVGRYLGWREDHAVIMQSDPDQLRRIARNFWVSDVQPFTEQQ